MRQSTDGSRPRTILLSKIRLDGDTQSRQQVNDEVVAEYAAAMKDGSEFPPLAVVFDGKDYWLFDGFHRRWAAVKAGVDKFKCVVTNGTREDARWLSYSVNTDHGLQRTNEDKKRAVIAALKHPKGAKLSDSKIAEHVGVNDHTVAKYRKQLVATSEIPKSPEREGADGRTINTANIGKSDKRDSADEPDVDEQEYDEGDDAGREDDANIAPARQEPNIIGQRKEEFRDWWQAVLTDPPHVAAYLRTFIAEESS